MKTIMKFTVVVAIMLTSIVGMAKEPKLSIVSENETKSLVFELDSQAKETTVQFVDADNNELYSELVSDKLYIKKFNLKNLEDGIYYFETEDAMSAIVYKISIKGDVVKIIERKENAKPVFRVIEDKVFVNLLNLGKEKVEIKVFDSLNRVVYKESLKDQSLVEKAFNFGSAFEDKYTIVVKDSNDIYYHNFVVN